MTGFAWGIVVGVVVTALLALAAGVWVVRRVNALRDRTRQAERLAELGTLTGGLAHEIKNPLSTVQLNLQLLAEDLQPLAEDLPRVVSRLATVQKETTRLRSILEDFLRFAGRIELERQPVELNELLEELVDFFAPQAQMNRVQLRHRRSPEPITISADPKLLKQAVLNLMLNAMQAMGDAGGELILSAALPEGGKLARVDVIDTGPGISPENVARIFQAYYSTKKGGTGLGLAMSKRIAEEHGGRLGVTSEVGRGSDFFLELPR